MKTATMTTLVGRALAVWALIGTAAIAADDYSMTDDELIEEGLTKREDPFEIFLGLASRVYTFQHSALQTRSDRAIDHSEDWRDGNLDGNGWGLQLAVARQTTRIQTTIMSSDYEYDLSDDVLDHRIRTDRRDFELSWEELSGQSERARWGWLLGVRYITLDERLTLAEEDEEISQTGSVEWFLAEAGYWGSIHPFYRPVMSVFGNTKIFMGEAEGLARTGSDTALDGTIEQGYDDDYSLAYGWEFTVGATFRIRNLVGLHVEYFREWLFSFESTDSGIMVFPDNNDALFIDESHGVHTFLSVIW